MNSMEMNVRRPRRMLSRGLSCLPSNENRLLYALLNRHIQTFTTILTSSAVDVNHIHEYPHYKTCLDIACCETKTLDFVHALLYHNANPNKINSHHGRAPLHFAIESRNFDIVERLLQVPSIDVNVCCKGLTPLNFLVKEALNDEDYLSDFVKCAIMLLKKGADPNIPDVRGATPIYKCANKELTTLITAILDHSKIGVDVDFYKDRNQKSARDIIEEKDLYKKKLPEIVNVDIGMKTQLFVFLSQRNEDKFIEMLTKYIEKTGSHVVNSNNGLHTLLQLAIDKELENAVKELLTNSADVNLVTENNSELPIELACGRGNPKILKMLIDQKNVIIPRDVLHSVVKYVNSFSESTENGFRDCIDLLLQDKRININAQDVKGNSALHYAVREGDDECVLNLLRSGASVAIRNNFNELPLADINPDTFQKYLDECLRENNERCTDENYQIIFKYGFLAPPANMKQCDGKECSVTLLNDTTPTDYHNNNDNVTFAHEAYTLLYMSKNPELKHLLKHPVLTSFLFLKWNRVKQIVYVNVAFYIAFCTMLISYILLGYGLSDEDNNTVTVIHSLLAVAVFMLSLREFIQAVINPREYFSNFENFLELTLIIVTVTILTHNPSEQLRQELSSVAILLCASEMILLIGQFPIMSTYIVMLRTVSWNFFKFLLWYSILIVAFALSFYTLFRESDEPENPPLNNTTPSENNEEENFFYNPGISLFKTIVMLTGEFDVGDIDFKHFPITSHIVFILFIFLIAIVLFNLLNGLAVSDTQLIKNNAELVGYIFRIRLICYIEGMILGNLPFSQKSPLYTFNCSNSCDKQRLYLRPLARKISLFPKYLPGNEISFMPNADNVIIYQHVKYLHDNADDRGSCCFPCSKCHKMDVRVVKSAKNLLIEKSKTDPLDEIKKSIENYELRLIENEKRFQVLEQNISKLVDMLSTK